MGLFSVWKVTLSGSLRLLTVHCGNGSVQIEAVFKPSPEEEL